MIYKDMKTPSDNMKLTNTEISQLIREQDEKLYKAEADKAAKAESIANREREVYYAESQSIFIEQATKTKNRMEFLQNVKEGFVTECIMKLYKASVTSPMTKRESVIARNLVTRFVKENGAGDLLNTFSTKNYLLSEFARICYNAYDKVVETCTPFDTATNNSITNSIKGTTIDNHPSDAKEWDLPKNVVDDFYKDLTTVDCTDASKLIKDRVADAVQSFIDSNAAAKLEYEDIISQAQEKINNAKDETIAEEYSMIAKRKINEMKITRPKNVLNLMVESLTRKVLTDDSYKERYVTEGTTVNMEAVVDDTRLIYTMLEMVSTTRMVNVDEDYIKSYLKSLV